MMPERNLRPAGVEVGSILSGFCTQASNCIVVNRCRAAGCWSKKVASCILLVICFSCPSKASDFRQVIYCCTVPNTVVWMCAFGGKACVSDVSVGASDLLYSSSSLSTYIVYILVSRKISLCLVYNLF